MINLREIRKQSIKTYLEILIPPIISLVINCLVYWGAPLISTRFPVHNLSGHIEELIPVMPVFIVVYYGCFIFWAVNYMIIAVQEKEHRYRFFTADLYARLLCFVCFVFFPTTNTRPELTGTGFFTEIVRWLYQIDRPTNLFPSIHCMTSWFSCIGLRGRKHIPKWYKGVSMVITVFVFVSTLTLRQHVLIDVIGGVLVAEITWRISKHTKGYLVYQKIVESLSGKISGKLKRNPMPEN